MPDVSDTIAAIATPPGGAARGMLRVSGLNALTIVEPCFSRSAGGALSLVQKATVVPRVLKLALHDRPGCLLPCDAHVWPGSASFTRQPTVELHTLGSPPMLQAALRRLCESGARLAEPGEFTLRAFLAGRLDLTQAEAVLGVIDARSTNALQVALRQLAGGLAQPLAALRKSLLELLADLEAGLDFAEEDIEFVSRDELQCRLAAAIQVVRAIQAQVHARSNTDAPLKAVLVGPPNSGKSSLFNALVQRFGKAPGQPAIVSSVPGTTRDYLSARLFFDGIECEIVDTAGEEPAPVPNTIAAASQGMTSDQTQQADLRLHCMDAVAVSSNDAFSQPDGIAIATKTDLRDCQLEGMLATSARTGWGLDECAAEIRRRWIARSFDAAGSMLASTGLRCFESLHVASESLERARDLASAQAGEELIAGELRTALNHLGRVVGAVYTDDILDHIFSRFCIGK